MSSAISDAMQIIEIIQKVRKIYGRIKGTGKEIDAAFVDVELMETELKFLEKTFKDKQTSHYPEIVSTITTQFKPLRKSMKQVRNLFEQYAVYSRNLIGKAFWAYNKRRDEIFQIQARFATYRSIFQRSLVLLNQGHNEDQAKKAKELKDQARRNEERRKAEDKARKKENQQMAKELKELKTMLKKNMKPEPAKTLTEKITQDEIQEWLMKEKGLDSEEAKSFLAAITANEDTKKVIKTPKTLKTKMPENNEKKNKKKGSLEEKKDIKDDHDKTKGFGKEPKVTKKDQEQDPDKVRKEKPRGDKEVKKGKDTAKLKPPVIITDSTSQKPKNDRKDRDKSPKIGHGRSKSQEHLAVPEKARPRSKSEPRSEKNSKKDDETKAKGENSKPKKNEGHGKSEEKDESKKERARSREPRPKDDLDEHVEKNNRDKSKYTKTKDVGSKEKEKEKSKEPKPGKVMKT